MMLFPDQLVVVRGGGDIGTGVVARLHRAGFPIVVLEVDVPLTVRRTVAVSTAVTDGEATVEDLVARRVASTAEAEEVAATGSIAVLVAPKLPPFSVDVAILVDARLAKRNIDTTLDHAGFVVALGPGFEAGVDCHVVVETLRGHHLGRVVWDGSAAPNTGVPGVVGGEGELRLLRAETAGRVSWEVAIGDRVRRDEVIGGVGERPVRSQLDGIARGLIAAGIEVTAGLKIGDVDPRADPESCEEISDKALAVGGGVLEAVLMHLNGLR